jgi:uncharacterized protein DUF3999
MTQRPILLLLLAAGAAAAQERPADHAYSAPVEVDGSSSHYRFSIPAPAYRGAARRDLGDMRVFNGAGEPVPYAFAPRDTQTAPPATQAVRLFPLYGDLGKGLERSSMRVERTARGSVVNVSIPAAASAAGRTLLGYVVDASELKAPAQALVLTWHVRDSFSGQARVEGSDDLKVWRAIVANAPILFLEHGGARLERNRVELAGTKAKYLMLSFAGVPREFALKEVRVELRSDTPEPAREWLSPQGTEGKARGELVFDTQGHFPIDRLRLALPQPNTVAEVQFLSRQRSDDPWRLAVATTAYRLGGNGEKTAEVLNPDIAVPANANRYWLLRVDQKGGGFGAGDVRLDVGWIPHELIFAARGTAPFTLAYGQHNAKPGALPAATVIPRRADGEIAPAKLVKVGAITEVRKPATSVFSDPLQFLRDLGAHGEGKKWLLWSALVAGVLFLAWMAFRLLRELGKQGAK